MSTKYTITAMPRLNQYPYKIDQGSRSLVLGDEGLRWRETWFGSLVMINRKGVGQTIGLPRLKFVIYYNLRINIDLYIHVYTTLPSSFLSSLLIIRPDLLYHQYRLSCHIIAKSKGISSPSLQISTERITKLSVKAIARHDVVHPSWPYPSRTSQISHANRKDGSSGTQ